MSMQFKERQYYPGVSAGTEFDPLINLSGRNRLQRKRTKAWRLGLILGVTAVCIALLLFLATIINRKEPPIMVPINPNSTPSAPFANSTPESVNLTSGVEVEKNNLTLSLSPSSTVHDVLPGHEDFPQGNNSTSSTSNSSTTMN